MRDQAPANTPDEWAGLREQHAVVPHQVVFRSFVSETVLLNVETGLYHGLDEVGGRFFEVLTAAPDLQSASETLATEFEQPLERIQEDMKTFFGELRELGLIELRAPGE